MRERHERTWNHLRSFILINLLQVVTSSELSTSSSVSTQSPTDITPSDEGISVDSSLVITNLSNETQRPLIDSYTNKPWLASWRLPTEVVPHLYTIRLEPEIKKGIFSGFVKIFFISSMPRDHIVLHAKHINVTNVKLYSNGLVKESIDESKKRSNTVQEESYEIGVKKWFPYEPFDFLIVVANETIAPDIEYEIHMNYTGSLLMGRLNGFYTSRYSVEGLQKLMGTTKFEPNYARLAFPCFDEPAMKAAVDIEIVKPSKNMTVVSNMPMVKEEPYGKNSSKYLVTFQGTPPLSMYTLCWIISDFQVVEQDKTSSGVLIRALAKNDHKGSLKYATTVTKKSVEFFEKYLGVDYSLPKLDIIGVPDFSSGAMENWGMVTFKETNVLTHPITTGYSDYFGVVNVICHEVAHMWFGNLVTMKWWNDIWLNEGFATYLSFKCTKAIEPQLRADELGFVNKKLSALIADTPLNSHPIINNVTKNEQLGGIFDEIAYRKGHSVLEMIEDSMGEDNFKKALNSYLIKHEFDVAKTSDLIAALNNFTVSENSGGIESLSGLVNDWTKQSGYPLVTVEKDGEKLILTQRRFSYRHKDSSLRANQNKWNIPITYRTADAPNITQRLLFDRENYSEVINLKNASDWYKLNIKGVGFYRVNYPEQTWQMFKRHLEDNSATLADWTDRANILDDACNLASTAHISYDIPLSLLNYLSKAKENHYAPWRVASKCLSDIKKRLPTAGTTYKLFHVHVRDLLSPPLHKVLKSINHNKSTPFDFNPSNEVVFSLACSFKQPDAIKKAKSLFHGWLDKSTPLNPDIKGVVFRYGVSGGDDETKKWEHVWNLYKEVDDPHELRDLRVALISVKNNTLLKRLIHDAKNESVVRTQDYYAILTSMANKKKTNNLVWDLIKKNYAPLQKKFSIGKLSRLFQSVVSNFYTEPQLDDVKKFIKKFPNVVTKKEDISKIEENILNNMKWRESHQRDIRFWLKKKLANRVQSSTEIDKLYKKNASTESDSEETSASEDVEDTTATRSEIEVKV